MELTIEQQIEELRNKIHFNRACVGPQQLAIYSNKTAVELARQARIKIEEEYAEKLRLAEEARIAAQQKVLEETQKLQALNNETAEYERQLNKLLEAQDNQARAAQLVDEISQLVREFEAWQKAHPYQIEDIVETIRAYKNGKGGMLNANDMSLGKTFETIVTLHILSLLFIEEYGRTPRILWVTKKSLVNSTPKEFRRWNPDKLIIPVASNKVSERNTQIELAMLLDGIVITNYEAIGSTPKLQETTWDFVVLDEVHKLKGGANYKPTRIFTSMLEVTRKARFQIMLSGTPMVNKSVEMWAYLHMFSPERFPDFKSFAKAYGATQELSGSMDIKIDPEKLLKGALKGQMIRRRKSEVGLQMPDLTVEEVTLSMNEEQRDLYDMMRENFFVWLDSEGEKPLTATAVIAQLIRLRQINVWPAGIKKVNADGTETILDVRSSSKIDEAMDKIQELSDSGEQVVVFCNFNEPMYEIKRRCQQMDIKCNVISGDSANLIGQYEEAFQQGKIDVLCINMAMGEGLNLHKDVSKWPGGASFGIILDKWYSPARNEQCISRIHRQGCTEPVTVYYLRNENSVDSFIEELEGTKRNEFAGIMESDMIRPSSGWREYLNGVL